MKAPNAGQAGIRYVSANTGLSQQQLECTFEIVHKRLRGGGSVFQPPSCGPFNFNCGSMGHAQLKCDAQRSRPSRSSNSSDEIVSPRSACPNAATSSASNTGNR